MSDTPQRFVLGVAYQAGPDPRIQRGADGGRDFFDAAELERAAWNYLRKGRQVGTFHVDGTEGSAEVVESFIWRWDPIVGDNGEVLVKAGDWCLGAVLDERSWDLYKRGKITGWSPQGTAKRRTVRPDETGSTR